MGGNSDEKRCFGPSCGNQPASGMGQVVGVVDLPVARRSRTDYPLSCSSLKGSLRDRAEQLWGIDDEKVERILAALIMPVLSLSPMPGSCLPVRSLGPL